MPKSENKLNMYDDPKHALIMRDWRLGKQIQIKHCTGKWMDIDNPLFDSRSKYRVKPIK